MKKMMILKAQGSPLCFLTKKSNECSIAEANKEKSMAKNSFELANNCNEEDATSCVWFRPFARY